MTSNTPSITNAIMLNVLRVHLLNADVGEVPGLAVSVPSGGWPEPLPRVALLNSGGGESPIRRVSVSSNGSFEDTPTVTFSQEARFQSAPISNDVHTKHSGYIQRRSTRVVRRRLAPVQHKVTHPPLGVPTIESRENVVEMTFASIDMRQGHSKKIARSAHGPKQRKLDDHYNVSVSSEFPVQRTVPFLVDKIVHANPATTFAASLALDMVGVPTVSIMGSCALLMICACFAFFCYYDPNEVFRYYVQRLDSDLLRNRQDKKTDSPKATNKNRRIRSFADEGASTAASDFHDGARERDLAVDVHSRTIDSPERSHKSSAKLFIDGVANPAESDGDAGESVWDSPSGAQVRTADSPQGSRKSGYRRHLADGRARPAALDDDVGQASTKPSPKSPSKYRRALVVADGAKSPAASDGDAGDASAKASSSPKRYNKIRRNLDVTDGAKSSAASDGDAGEFGEVVSSYIHDRQHANPICFHKMRLQTPADGDEGHGTADDYAGESGQDSSSDDRVGETSGDIRKTSRRKMLIPKKGSDSSHSRFSDGTTTATADEDAGQRENHRSYKNPTQRPAQ